MCGCVRSGVCVCRCGVEKVSGCVRCGVSEETGVGCG